MYFAHRRFRAILPVILGVIFTGLPLLASSRRSPDVLLASTLIPVDFFSATYSNPSGAYVIPSSLPGHHPSSPEGIDNVQERAMVNIKAAYDTGGAKKTGDSAQGATESKLWYDLANSLGVAPANGAPVSESDSDVELESISELSVTGMPSHSALLLLATGLALIFAGRRLG